MWKKIGPFASAILLLTLSRWMLHIAKPMQDLRSVDRLWWQIRSRLSGGWRVFWRRFGPITGDMYTAWTQLRDRYQGGAFGEAGT